MDATEEPLAYTIGDQPFLGLAIYLDSRPLIPRPETEWWTEKMIEEVGGEDSGVFRSATAREAAIFQPKNTRPPKLATDFRVLDLCAGSGAIGCAALKMLPNAQVYFGEIDPRHEATILKNIRENNLDESRAHVYIGDLFDPFPDDLRFDVIATNPPYIPACRTLPRSVADYEPGLALFSGADGLDLTRRIATSVRCHLTEGGVLWCECDSAYAEAARALFEAEGLNATIRTDQYGEPRVIIARLI